ncbi:MAG: hypothetical protein DHS20C15_33010 [Planctomycetota bacterium]|nr:MAG: hypothetical protein DHS20C15_33010 [Planctomycetota bacterium]
MTPPDLPGNAPAACSARRLRARLRADGFTLAELLVVLAIFGVLAGVVGLNSTARHEHLLEVMEMQVREAAARARELARSTHEPHGVLFDVSSDRLGIVDERGALVQDPLTQSAWVVDARGSTFGGGVDISSADFGSAGKAAIFDSQGVPLAGGGVTLRAGDSLRVLALDPATGIFYLP